MEAILLGVFYVLVLYMFLYPFCIGILFLEYRDFGTWLHDLFFNWTTFLIIFIVIVIIFLFYRLITEEN